MKIQMYVIDLYLVHRFPRLNKYYENMIIELILLFSLKIPPTLTFKLSEHIS